MTPASSAAMRPVPAGSLAACLLGLAAALLVSAAGAAEPRKAAAGANRKAAAAKPQAPAAGPAYAARADAMAFADDIAARRGLDAAWVREVIGSARLLPQVPRLMLPPTSPAAKNWRAYRGRFVESIRIRAGLRFWEQNAATLARAEREFGVPAEIIVGIIGVETIYGQQTGGFRVLDTLATLSFDFPTAHPRAADRVAYFRGELEQFLGQAARAGTDPLAARGSYAGATGMPQFMPSSIAKFAVDYDGDGRIDLLNSAADAIGSVANYFVAHGWKPGQPVWFPVEFDNARLQRDTLLAPDILPTFSAQQMAELGVLLPQEALTHTGPLALVELQNGGDTPTYVAGTQNFYAITRYNWSSYYAMAVESLGRAVAGAR